MFGHELRASAAGRLRPADRCAIDFHRGHARSRADGPAQADLRDASCSPPPGGGCGLPIAPRPNLTQDTPPQIATAARQSLRDRVRRLTFLPQSASQSIHSTDAIGQSETTSHRFPVRVRIFSSVMRPFSHTMSIV